MNDGVMRTAYFGITGAVDLKPAPGEMGIPMAERRSSSRQRSFLQGRIYYNNRRSSVDCLVRDVSDAGAKLVFAGAVTIPDVVELYLSNKEEVRRARIEWRKGDETGVSFRFEDSADAGALAASTDLFGRVLKLERECASLKRVVSELRADIRRMNSEMA
jgi:hypothetical protein